MTSTELARVRELVDELANAVEVVALVTEHLTLAASATAQDARNARRSLERVMNAIRHLRSVGGAP